jgi:hypothetical protein
MILYLITYYSVSIKNTVRKSKLTLTAFQNNISFGINTGNVQTYIYIYIQDQFFVLFNHKFSQRNKILPTII